MAKLSTCKNCGCELQTNEKYKHNNKMYCKNCYDDIQFEKEQYKLLIKTVCEYLRMDVPDGLVLKQIKQYKDEFNYSYAGMNYTLWYINNIENKQFTESKYGIALVKFYYQKAKLYFEQQQKISDSMVNCDHIEKIKEVKINLNKVYQKANMFLLDINELVGDDI